MRSRLSLALLFSYSHSVRIYNRWKSFTLLDWQLLQKHQYCIVSSLRKQLTVRQQCNRLSNHRNPSVISQMDNCQYKKNCISHELENFKRLESTSKGVFMYKIFWYEIYKNIGEHLLWFYFLFSFLNYKVVTLFPIS